MKYHIDTIPVWDAYKKDCECPLCVIKNKYEQDLVDLFLGGSVMEPDWRIEVNEKGFCSKHIGMLFHGGHKLGIALMADTHLRESIRTLEKNAKNLTTSRKPKKDIDKLIEAAFTINNTCIMCDKLNKHMARYAYTIIHLWHKDPSFKDVYLSSRGFCFEHFELVLSLAAETLNNNQLKAFLADTLPLQFDNLKRLEGELEWFTQKFDYKNRDKDWGTSKDALIRAVQVLNGNQFDN